MRTILDLVNPQYLRGAFLSIFRALQRGKALEPFIFMQGCYLLSLDGTGVFSSKKLNSDSCMQKKDKKTGDVKSYYQQMLGASIVHP